MRASRNRCSPIPCESSNPRAAQTQKKLAESETAGVREVCGKVQSIKETAITIQTRTGNTIEVDSAQRIKAVRSARPLS